MENEKNYNLCFETTVYRLISYFLHGPYWFKIFCCYFIVLLSAAPFYFGYQIYPVNNIYNTQDMNPECLSIEKIGYFQEGNFFNLTYSLNLKDSMTRDISFSLFRVYINGEFYKEELRRDSIDQIFRYPNDLYSLSYELFQEGQTNFTVKCIDRDLFSKNIDVNEIRNSNKFTIFHKDHSISNICLTSEKAIIFVRNNINYFMPDMKNQFAYENSSIESFLSKNRNFQIPSYPVIELYQKTAFELLSEILPYTFYLSQNNANDKINNLMVNTYLKESPDIINFIQSITNIHLVISNFSFNHFCYSGNVRLHNYSIRFKLLEKTIKNDSKKSKENYDEINAIYDSFKQISLNKYGNTAKNAANGNQKIVFAINEFDDFSNLNELKELFSSNPNFKIINMSGLTIQQKIFEFSDTQIMISVDDGNEVSNAMWMTDDSTLIVLHEKRERLSRAIKFIKGFNIDVYPVDFYIDYNSNNNQKIDIPVESIEKVLKEI